MVSIPEYVPIPSSLGSKFERLHDASISQSELKSTEKELLNAAVEFLDQIVDDNVKDTNDGVDRLAPLKRLLEAFETIVQTQYKTRQFATMFDNTKGSIRARSRREPELELSTLDTYLDMNADDVMFSRLLEKQRANIRVMDVKTEYKTNADYNYLKNAAFILDHPLDPLPDDNEDDDIQVEGGKVDIKCPISLKLFETPMTSKVCGHTYDAEAINGTWTHQNMVQRCPTPGCNKNLRFTDFEEDRLMNLRVKSYMRMQQKLEGDTHYERL